jgi:catechol 2,3-dioxygenase-like lactoylglutathione lyase family enzyme
MKKNIIIITAAVLLIGMIVTGYATNGSPVSGLTINPVSKPRGLDIKANITFFYYKNLAGAADFYENVMGLQLVLDYGFAKAYRVSKTSFLCLVDETKGMHKTTEPKAVTLSFISREVDGWYRYLKAKGVKMHSPLKNSTRLPIRGFVARDPEGYYLEFETFLGHDQNKKLLAILAKTSTLYAVKNPAAARPKELGVQGNILWLYYKDLKGAQQFYEENLELKLLVDQGFAKVYTSSPSAFIGLVDEAKGLHRFSAKKSVNVGFITGDVDKWYDYLLKKGLKMRGSLDNAEKGRVRAFVTYDSAGYYLEFDKFLPHETNKVLIELLKN